MASDTHRTREDSEGSGTGAMACTSRFSLPSFELVIDGKKRELRVGDSAFGITAPSLVKPRVVNSKSEASGSEPSDSIRKTWSAATGGAWCVRPRRPAATAA